MDKKRAQEIASCPTMMNVTCNGVPIYIEDINESSSTAKIHPLNAPQSKEEVSLTSLIEH